MAGWRKPGGGIFLGEKWFDSSVRIAYEYLLEKTVLIPAETPKFCLNYAKIFAIIILEFCMHCRALLLRVGFFVAGQVWRKGATTTIAAESFAFL
jgi:hypothetical protein